MSFDPTKEREFDWGDSVRVTRGTPEEFARVKAGSVCGIRVIESEDVEREFSQPIGSKIYLVEGASGEAVEIPACFLERY